jgi:hypothetical protein
MRSEIKRLIKSVILQLVNSGLLRIGYQGSPTGKLFWF